MSEPRVDNRKIRKQQIVRFVLKEDLTAGGEAEAYLRLYRGNGTFETTTKIITVHDDTGGRDGVIGDKGLAVWMSDASRYEIIDKVC